MNGFLEAFVVSDETLEVPAGQQRHLLATSVTCILNHLLKCTFVVQLLYFHV